MILSMTVVIDDKAKPAAPGIFVARDQEATLVVACSPVPADNRHDLGHAGVLIGEDCRYDNVVRGMTLIERPAILEPAFALGQLTAVDRPQASGQVLRMVFSAVDRS